MNKASLTPAIVRMLTLSTIPLFTYFGVTQYNELNKVELPELSIIEEPEEVLSSAPQETVKRTRKVWKQTKGQPFNSWFSNSYTTYNYSNKALASFCKKPILSIYRNWCNQAEFKEVEEEIQS